MVESGRMTLDHIYNGKEGLVFMTGIQALVRLPLMQRQLDRARGLETPGWMLDHNGGPRRRNSPACAGAARRSEEPNQSLHTKCLRDLLGLC